MDVTPTNKMFEAMAKMTDAICGEAPLAVESSKGAEQRRNNRKLMMDFLHRLVHLSMREGAARAMNTQTRSGIQLPPSING